MYFAISHIVYANDPLTCWLVSLTVKVFIIGTIFSDNYEGEQYLANSDNLIKASDFTSGSLSYINFS